MKTTDLSILCSINNMVARYIGCCQSKSKVFCFGKIVHSCRKVSVSALRATIESTTDLSVGCIFLSSTIGKCMINARSYNPFRKCPTLHVQAHLILLTSRSVMVTLGQGNHTGEEIELFSSSNRDSSESQKSYLSILMVQIKRNLRFAME